MKVFDKVLDVLGFTEIREEEALEDCDVIEEVPEWKPRKPRAQVLPFGNSATKDAIKVILSEPLSFDDCQQIADNLKNKRTVIVNLENLEMGLARRVIDFVGGTAYALGGTLQKIGAGIIIVVPNNVDISGDISSMTQPKEVFAWINKLNQGTEFRGY